MEHQPEGATVDRRTFLTASFCAGLAGFMGVRGGLALAAGETAPRTTVALAEVPSLPKAPGYYPFSVGDMRAMVVSDGTLQFKSLDMVLVGDDKIQKQAGELMAENFLTTKNVEAALNTVLVMSGDKPVLIDLGYGAAAEDPGTGRQSGVLAAAGLRDEDIRMIFITHAHPDHFFGYLKADGTPRFPNAELVMSEPEHAFWSQDKAPVAALEPLFAKCAANFRAAGDRLRLIKPDGEIAPGLVAVPAFGHTPGHCQVRIQSGGDSLLLTADTANHALLYLRHTDWGFSYDADKPMAAKTRLRALEACAADRTRMLAYHFPFPGIGHIRKHSGGGFEWVAEGMKI